MGFARKGSIHDQKMPLYGMWVAGVSREFVSQSRVGPGVGKSRMGKSRMRKSRMRKLGVDHRVWTWSPERPSAQRSVPPMNAGVSECSCSNQSSSDCHTRSVCSR
jgi:hypothetical protein